MGSFLCVLWWEFIGILCGFVSLKVTIFPGQVFINVPWYFSMLYSMFSPFLTHRTKSKFVIAREGNVAETLYKYATFLLPLFLNNFLL